ncbi:MAG: YtxH domain-containing protein [Candidatus Shapirobacteria bacterium]
MSKSTGKFFLASILGAVAGAIGGLLFAPQSGEETRENITKIAKEVAKQIKTGAEETSDKVKEVFGEATKAASDKYNEIKTAVVNKIATVKAAGQEIDKDKYALIVDGVIDEFKDDFKVTKNGATKMANLLKKDWLKIKKALA